MARAAFCLPSPGISELRCVQPRARGCKAEGKVGLAPPPLLFLGSLRRAAQNMYLTQQDRIVRVTGHTSYESVEPRGTGCQSHLSTCSPPEAAPLNKRMDAKGEGYLGSTPQARNLMAGPRSGFLSFP